MQEHFLVPREGTTPPLDPVGDGCGRYRGFNTKASTAQGQPPRRNARPSAGRPTNPRAVTVGCVVLLLCLVILCWPALQSGWSTAAGGGEGMTVATLGRDACTFLLGAGLPSPSFPWRGTADGTATTETDAATENGTDGATGTDTSPTEGDESDGQASEGDETADEISTETDESPTWTAMPIVSADMSSADCGSGHMVCDEGAALVVPATEWSWSTDGPPTVLIVHSHPFEAYGGREGLTNWSPTDPSSEGENIAALGEMLAERLVAQGVRVIRVTPDEVGVTASMSYQESYRRTAAAVAAALARDASIGLVIDLRRSAELVTAPDGTSGVLRTEGTWQGAACAQVQISVHTAAADNPGESPGASRDATPSVALGAALAWRDRLWACSPTLSRPVRLRDGQGMAVSADGTLDVPAAVPAAAPRLTVEIGAAGNTFAEAKAIVTPLAVTLASLILAHG